MSEDAVSLSARQAFMALNGLPKIGPVTIARLLEAFGNDPAAILSASRRDLRSVRGVGEDTAATLVDWRSHVDLAKQERRLAEYSAGFILRDHEAYPRLLREIYDPPVGLYCCGAERIAGPLIAIVGTRRATLYGRAIAKRLGADLARAGFGVVSGLARGIDAAAHEGALEAGGLTIGVLGCGLDIVYPPEHLDLYRRMQAEAVLMSEFPFGRRADRLTFPRRNRLISGMCDAVVVVESSEKGGSMITAKMAADQGRSVFAVPGRIDQESSRGCHQLIREGATLLTSSADIVSELRYLQLELNLGAETAQKTEAKPATPGLPSGLSPDEEKVARCFLDGGILHPDQVAHLSGLSTPQVSAALLMLELKQILAKRGDGSFEIRLNG